MNDILTDNGHKLTIFENNIIVDKKLQKWQRAEAGLEKTETKRVNVEINDNIGLGAFLITNSNDPDGLSYSEQLRSRDIDSNVDAGSRWLTLYEIAEGVSFDDLATAGIKDLTRLIAEKKLKFVIGGYGSFGNTQNTLVLSSNEINRPLNDHKETFFNKLKSLFTKVKKEDNMDNEIIDALEFFSLVKLSSKDSVSTYRDRVSDYLTAIHNAVTVGQTALVEDLLKGLITNKYESVLYAEGLYYVINEEQMVSFVKKCEKGIKLDYVKNFTRPMPQDVVNKIAKINQLEVFDNYVVLYYDPDGKVYKETAKEEAKRKDPIIFGVIAGSEKLYYIADWVDEYCDLSLEKFIDAIGVKKEELIIDYPNLHQDENKVISKKKIKKNNYKKK